ncbi:unnamed protein product [Peronospora belbahrii]|uniref:Uncharacterized protein n=1 Tax=Peronospora belbahrii TaxID=622444 RepID=A0AAU9KNG4_9STRA|nr:unnamed protein product [Peronospora belbahrii]
MTINYFKEHVTESLRCASAESDIKSVDSIKMHRMSLGPTGVDILRELTKKQQNQVQSNCQALKLRSKTRIRDIPDVEMDLAELRHSRPNV